MCRGEEDEEWRRCAKKCKSLLNIPFVTMLDVTFHRVLDLSLKLLCVRCLYHCYPLTSMKKALCTGGKITYLRHCCCLFSSCYSWLNQSGTSNEPTVSMLPIVCTWLLSRRHCMMQCFSSSSLPPPTGYFEALHKKVKATSPQCFPMILKYSCDQSNHLTLLNTSNWVCYFYDNPGHCITIITIVLFNIWHHHYAIVLL